jgi:hypothetical protein
MHYSVELLVRGDPAIVEYYRTAAHHWQGIWAKEESRNFELLAKLLTAEQDWFERHCGGRWLGQEVMVVSGLAGLYTTAAGFNHNLERARRLYDAIQSSFCSVEVKSIAEEVAKSYDLLDSSVL